jgi:hypothetical protein
MLPFEREARDRLEELQGALGDVVAKLPDSVGRAVELQRSLGLDNRLGWKLYRFVTTSDPLVEIPNIPGEPSMRRILSAASKRGVPKTVTERAAAAFERFEEFVADHGGDRDEIISLANGLSPAGGNDQQHELKVRKSAFKSLSHLWGIKAETTVLSAVVHGGSSADPVLDHLVVRGYIGLQRLRHGVPLTFGIGVLNHPKKGTGSATDARDIGAPPSPLSKEGAIGELHLLKEFSSHPLPQMRQRPEVNGRVDTDVVFPPSGRAGAVTLYTSQFAAGATDNNQSMYSLGALISIPSQTLVAEILVPQGWTDPSTLRVAMYGRRSAVERVGDRRPEDLLPQHETPRYIGVMDTSPDIPGVPHHSEAVRHEIVRLGWQDTRFDVYRCAIEFPLMHSMIWMVVEATKP